MKILDQLNWRSEPAESLDLAQYQADGVAVVRRIFPSPLRRDLERGWLDWRARIERGDVKREARFVRGTLPEPMASLYTHEQLVQAAQGILGTENVALYMNRLLLKDEHWNGAVAIHQDMPYFSGGLEKVSVFVPLTPTAARGGNGGLIFLKGSHKYGNLQRGTIIREKFPTLEDLGPSLDVGDVVFMNFLTWHYSEDAVHPDDRPLMQITYQPATDGSYASALFGVPTPTLVSGKWMTEHFAPCFESTIPDA